MKYFEQLFDKPLLLKNVLWIIIFPLLGPENGYFPNEIDKKSKI